ncbi:MAG: CoA transferase [Acidobacteria bacterium]|nr:MAG: CoA transferase [Acidobacteriota bacterium]
MSRDALEHLRVVEFGGYAAGPAIGKYLANFGARVVHVEAESRPDGFRLQYPPYKDDVVGLNRSGCFSFFNDSKRGVTLELKTAQGLALAHRLGDWAHVVIENMRPGVMDRLGLGWDVLRRRNPSLVMLSTSNMGQTGPYAAHPGFGSQLSSLSGFTHLIGDPGGPPGFLYGPYIDFIAAAYGGCAVLAAVDHARRTGEGVLLDLSQYEAGLQFVGTALLDHAASGVVATRNRNRDPVAVPHGCYPCADGWCVMSCWDEAEWRRLCAAAGPAGEAWGKDARFGSAAERRAHEEALNAALAAWTSGQAARALMTRLQVHGVHAAMVNTVKDLFDDPQLVARGVWQEQVHPEIGPQRYRMVSYQLSETPGRVRSPAPCLGQDNEEVFTRWLGSEESLAV